MGSHGWRSDRSLRDQLHLAAYRFGFYQAVRLIEKDAPAKTPVGEGSAADREAVRFTSNVSQTFPASELSDLDPGAQPDGPARMAVNFMGLAGSLGPLPAPYTELILERVRHKDTALKDFLDIFNHRLISLLYRVRKVHRPGFDLAHPSDSRFAWYFLSLVGLGTEGLRQRMAVSDRAMLHYTALLSQQPRSMSGLQTLLGDYFKTPVTGRQLEGQWMRLDDDQLTRIGFSGRNQVLGRDTMLAFRVWDQQSRFMLCFDGLDRDTFMALLPPGRGYRPLCQITRFYAGHFFDFIIALTVRASEVPRARLGAADGARLGWTSWIRAGRRQAAAGRVTIEPRLVTQLKDTYGFDYEDKAP